MPLRRKRSRSRRRPNESNTGSISQPLSQPADATLVSDTDDTSGGYRGKGSGSLDPVGTNTVGFDQDTLDETLEGEGYTTSVTPTLIDTTPQPDPVNYIDPVPVPTGALPSLPSMSNVGTIPMSGSVDWNIVPGGFQPLPQTTGRSKKIYQLSQFHGGVNQKSSPRDISDFECQDATNVTFSRIGRIKTLGEIDNENNDIDTMEVDTTDRGVAGYGLFQFSAPADWDGANTGEYTLTLSADGDQVDIVDPADGRQTTWMDFAGDDNHDVAQVYYASGNGLYLADANFANTNNVNKVKIYVYREDAGSSQTVSGWKEGKVLIDSPTYDDAVAGSMAAGDVKVKEAAEAASVDGSMIVECTPTGTGTWNGDYYFYVSWLFDGGCETGLTSAGDDDGNDSNSNGITFSNETLEFNINLMHDPHATANTELGGDKRIEGGRIYFKKTTDSERFLLAEFNLIDGVKGALDSTFFPWTESSNNYSLGLDIVFDNPPEIYTNATLNGYYPDEVYGESPDINADNATGPVAHSIRYRTAVVGQRGVVFIGNVKFKGRHMPDTMMFSMPGKPGVFPKFNTFDSPGSDGAPIMALAAFRDVILQFTANVMHVVNVSNPGQFYVEASYRNCGVHNPCQVFVTPFGVAFANYTGCYLYDGSKVVSLSSNKFHYYDTDPMVRGWDLPLDIGSAIGNDGAGVPSVGFCPRNRYIIILNDINDGGTGGFKDFIYDIGTQSWSRGKSLITNGSGVRHTNFIITEKNYLSVLRDNQSEVLNFAESDGSGSGGQGNVTYWTKDFDFGFPSQTKRLVKVYITYRGDMDAMTVAYAVDGELARGSGSFSESEFYNFSTVSYGGTTDPTPLLDKDLGSAQDFDKHTVAVLYPDDIAEGKDWKSISIYFNGTMGKNAEINDISIVYRMRPIK